MGRLLLLFILVPAIELILLIEIGGMIGTVATLAIILITGTLGATLARRQGLGVLRDLQTELARGGLPAGSLFDGALILVAGALLLTPGFLTDIVGFSLLVPGFRGLLRKFAIKRIEKAVREGNAIAFVQFGLPGGHRSRSHADRNNIEI